jgi:Flp pilus assembly protein TadD
MDRLTCPVVAALFALAVGACRPEASVPEPGSEAYREAVGAFYAGLAAMEVSADAHAERELSRASELAAGEPAVWADLGLLALRRNELEVAGERLERAQALAPANSQVEVLLAALESQRGESEATRGHLARAIELDSTNVRAMFTLSSELERGDDADKARAARWLERILSSSGVNTAVQAELARLAASDWASRWSRSSGWRRRRRVRRRPMTLCAFGSNRPL